MTKYIKVFKTINNGTGGLLGLKTIKCTKKIANGLAQLEDCKRVTVVNCSNSTTSLVKTTYSKINLRKKNTNSFLSKKQLQEYSKSKKKPIYLYKKDKIFLGNANNLHGARVLAKIN